MWSAIYEFLFLHEILQHDKFEHADLKHDNNILKFQAKNTHKLGIFGPRFKDFYFAPNFAVRQIWGRWFQIWQWLFRILAWKYPNKVFFCPKCKHFLILHEASHIEIFQPKIPKYEILFENSKVFFFLSETLSELNFI